MNIPKLYFVYYHNNAEYWKDGLSEAIGLLKNDYQVIMVNLYDKKVPEFESGIFLGWGAFGSPADLFIRKIERMYGNRCTYCLCLAGNVVPVPDTDIYSTIFYETDWVRGNYLRYTSDAKLHKAFGINTKINNSNGRTNKYLFDYLGVGAFANWKRWEMMIEMRGKRLIVGEIQKDNMSESMAIITHLLNGGVMIGGMIDPFALSDVYCNSKTVYIPANIYGGGERAVLEARACGCEVIVEKDNAKLQELVKQNVIPTHEDYYKSLKDRLSIYTF